MARQFIFFGDSDISRWPSALYPTPQSSSAARPEQVVSNYGKGGAELADVLHQIEQWKTEMFVARSNIAASTNGTAASPSYLFICCAGENDIGCGRSLDQILETFRTILDRLFPSSESISNSESSSSDQPFQSICNDQCRMIFFGPKFEPWLANDNASRKQYTKLNNGFQRAIRKHHTSSNNHKMIYYVDCLTLFCTKDTANLPGAVYGCKAIPDTKYFGDDGLHLNDLGYGIWKKIAEEKIAQIE